MAGRYWMVLGALGWICTLALPTELGGKGGDDSLLPPGPMDPPWCMPVLMEGCGMGWGVEYGGDLTCDVEVMPGAIEDMGMLLAGMDMCCDCDIPMDTPGIPPGPPPIIMACCCCWCMW